MNELSHVLASFFFLGGAVFSVRSEVRRVHPVVGEMIVLPSATRPDTHTLLLLPTPS